VKFRESLLESGPLRAQSGRPADVAVMMVAMRAVEQDSHKTSSLADIAAGSQETPAQSPGAAEP